MSIPSIRLLIVRGAITFSIAIAVFVHHGCSEPSTTASRNGSLSPLSPAALFTGRTTTYGFIRIVHETVGNAAAPRVAEGRVTCAQGFQSGTCFDAGRMTAGGITFPRDTSIGYWTTNADLRFGGTSLFGVAGNSEAGIPRIVDSLYVPAIIYLRAPTAPHGPDVEQTYPLEIRWNVDLNNDSVLVFIRYNADTSRKVVPSLPASDYWWYRWVPDNGAYEVASSVLSAFPVKGIITVGVLRGRSKIIGPSSYPMDAYGYSKAEGLFRVAP